MKLCVISIAATLMLAGPPLLHADQPEVVIPPESSGGKKPVLEPGKHLARPDGHAPLGVMFDHAHSAGEFMLGYRYIYSRDQGLLQGSNPIAASQVFATAKPDGSLYTAAPVEMDMNMQMAELMWAPADWITLMVMPMYMEMTMKMESQGGGHGHGEAGHDAGHEEPEAHGSAETSTHSHSTAGWGDTSLSALIPVWRGDTQKLLFILGVNAPTGSVDETMDNRYTHYMMQLGSGTRDLRPGITYTGYLRALSWGGQALGTIRLEEMNDSGYSLGDAIDLTAWTSWILTDSLSISGRLGWRSEGEIENHYNGPHNHSSPPDLQINYGGERLDAGLGLNFIMPGGPLRGHRLAIEALTPLYQDVNGIQLERDVTLFAGWQFAF